MSQFSDVVHVLFGAAFTVAVCLALGNMLLRRVRVSLHRQEAALIAFVCGSAILSILVFLLCVVQQARRGVFLTAGSAAIVWAVYQLRGRPPRKALPATPRFWSALFLAVFAAFFVIYFFNALAPEVSPDGSGYHLGNVSRIFRHHGFVWNYRSLYSYLSQGMEMLFLVAFAIGRHSAAAMVHFVFLSVLPLLVVCYGRRFGFPKAAVAAAILVYASPVAGKDGTSAYNDLTVATLLFSVFYLLQVWDEIREHNLLILIGLLCGFGYGVKYTAGLALPFAVGFVWWRLPLKARRWREVLAVMAPAVILSVPWMLRNWIWVANPFAPFLNRWFPNPYYHTGMEALYLDDLRHYDGIAHFWQIPEELAWRGGVLPGILGPVFLLAPLALLALRRSEARRLLCAALVFAVPAYYNVGPRFLIPLLPFFALAMGLALEGVWGVLPAIALAHALLSWPSVLSLYCAPLAWRITTVPVAAALRRIPESVSLETALPDYSLKRIIENEVPREVKIYSVETRAEAYIDRTIVVQYESTLGNLAQEITLAPFDATRPTQVQRFRFLPVTTRAVRMVQTASTSSFWSVSEMRAYFEGRELPRSGWTVSAWPNGWEVALAFDNRYATRWSNWQAMAPGTFIQVNFGKPQPIDEVDLELSYRPEFHVEVQVLTDRGRWVPLTDRPGVAPLNVPSEIRREAALELKARGIGYLWINDSDFVAADMRTRTQEWGITQVGAARGERLYRIE